MRMAILIWINLTNLETRIETIKFEYLTNKEALTMSVDLIKSNYKEFIQIFLENKGDE